ncbi:MAG: acetate--CoA ligase family protein [Bacteroidales bacterium]|nr:acetate--CoA ligase family protein [Bacteroidales bacterium]
MINQQLINPTSIVVIGGSDDLSKPGGKVLKNIVDGNFKGELFVINPKSDQVQGIKSYRNPEDMPDVDLAILAIAAKYCPNTVDLLARNKKTRAFIILSAGFSEESEAGAILEKQIVEIINDTESCLIGPNCVGFLNRNYNGVFTEPIPVVDEQGVDFVSGSGATAVFIMESGIPKGLTFSSVYSVGNSAQTGVEYVLKYMDETYVAEKSPKVKLLYIESIRKPELLLKHASSLVRKGCRIAAIKAGTSEAGSRAAASHTGALASSDMAVDALFRKAGIIRCYGREELATVASILRFPFPKGGNIAIITHAGGPAVMLTDILSEGGFNLPLIEGYVAEDLLAKLFPGSSVNNPIDFLATGTAEQLGAIIDACENDFDQIDAMVVIFGSPGLFPVYDVYDLLDEKIKTCKKPIYPVLPSVITARNEIDSFLEKKNVFFHDEVLFGKAFSKVMQNKPPADLPDIINAINRVEVRKLVAEAEDGFLEPEAVSRMLDLSGIPRVQEEVATTIYEAVECAGKIGFPLVMKVVGPVHKSDVGGVELNVSRMDKVKELFTQMMKIKNCNAILFQPMASGMEFFAGIKKEGDFGHMLLCGLGGIYIEVLKDVSSALLPINENEAHNMIKTLKSYALIKGVRGGKGVDEVVFAGILLKLSELIREVPEIVEMDLNPLLANEKEIFAVDARVRIERINNGI